jgi:hypothetical protein
LEADPDVDVEDLHIAQQRVSLRDEWFAGTFVFSIPAFLFYDPVLNDADYILGAGADTRTEFGAFLEILTAICNIATAVVLFPILRRVNEAVALRAAGPAGVAAARPVPRAAIRASARPGGRRAAGRARGGRRPARGERRRSPGRAWAGSWALPPSCVHCW